MDNHWIIAKVSTKWYAFEQDDQGNLTDKVYDPEKLSGQTAKFNPRVKMTEERAKRMVDKMNRKSALIEVDGRGNPKQEKTEEKPMKYQAYIDEEEGKKGNLCVLEFGADGKPTAAATYIVNAVGRVGKRVDFSPMSVTDDFTLKLVREQLNNAAQRIDLTQLTNEPQDVEVMKRDERDKQSK